MHYRSQNNGFDSKEIVEKMPSKFPPDSFYLTGINEVAKIIINKPLFIYIFTDDPEPKKIRDKFYNQLSKKISNFIIECRTSKNHYDLNVLEDFFSMVQFDSIIYPISAYSCCAATISRPIIEVTPPGWGIYSKDKDGNTIVDTVINSLIIIRHI